MNVCLCLSGCEAEVPLSLGGSNSETGRAGEKDWEGCGGVKAVLGGPPAR